VRRKEQQKRCRGAELRERCKKRRARGGERRKRKVGFLL